MKTLVLFGAGQGAKAFLKQLNHSEQIIAVCDNDPNKHGGVFEGYPVIAPGQLARLSFDQVVITTQWFKEVCQQLIEEFHIPPEQLIIPDKAQLKSKSPFADPATHQLARDALVTLCTFAAQEQLSLMIDFGTLLGLVRNQNILPWDDDIDFAVDVSEHDKVLHVLKKFNARQPIKWQLSQLVDLDNQVASYTLSPSDPSFQSFEISVCFRKTENDRSVHLPSLGMWYAPAKHFKRCGQIQWQGVTVLTPYQPLEYLAFLYGYDWRQEKKVMAIGDYAHTERIEFDKVKQSSLRTLAVQTKILVFGTGLAGQRAYEYYQHQTDIEHIGWLDNDPKKQGKTFLNLPIFSPSSLQRLTFDRVMIASSFHKEIRKQLLDSLNLDESLVQNIPAHVLKGTGDLSNPSRFDCAKKLMLALCQILDQHGIPYYVDHGTLLGLYRDGNLLPWDNDIDIAVDAEHLPALQATLWSELPEMVITDCKSNQWTMTPALNFVKMKNSNEYRKRIIKVFNFGEDPVSQSLNADIIIKYKDEDTRYWLVGSTVLSAPDDYTKDTIPYNFEGVPLKIPKFTDEYLTVLYNDWKTPVKGWDHSMYSNIKDE